MRLLSHLLDRFIQKGTLHVIDAEGTTHTFAGMAEGPEVTLKLHDPKLYRELFFNSELKTGEAYMDGRLTVENGGTIHDFLFLFSINRYSLESHPIQKVVIGISKILKRVHQWNPVQSAEQNARHHYDISRELYQLFLDDSMQYSCAYFADPDNDTLEQAQLAKKRHIAAKLQLKPGMTIAEIGSGWGSLACYLAKIEDVRITAVNVSPEQIKASRERAEAEGVADRVRFEQMDYRNLRGEFDRIFSVGMFEHVGVPHFDEYFGKMKELLKPDGYMMLHAIGSMSPPSATSPFIRKYIFPGGYTPAMSEVYASTERSGLWVSDAEYLRLHYYHTLRHWRERFTANREKAKAIYDERFCRMWEYYLAASETSFRYWDLMNFQIQITRDQNVLPLTRNYMIEEEERLRAEDERALGGGAFKMAGE